MAELTVRFDLSFGSRSLRAILVGSMILSAASEVASESVTLNTYYPAPSGVYVQMIATGATFLARDSGCLDVGTSAAGCNGVEMYVNGTTTLNGNTTINGSLNVTGAFGVGQIITTGNNIANTGAPCTADVTIGSSGCIAGSTRHDSSVMFWSNASASRILNSADVFYLSVWNANPTAGANIVLGAASGSASTFNGPVTFASNVTISGFQKTTGAIETLAGASCSTPVIGFGGSCPGGQYITNVGGVYSSYYSLGAYSDFAMSGGAFTGGDSGNGTDVNTIQVICCTCPPGGCTL
jgi:hypothetical protein